MLPNKVWWIVGEDGLPHGRISAPSFEEADKILFKLVLEDRFPITSTLEEGEEELEEITDSDIISVEYTT